MQQYLGSPYIAHLEHTLNSNNSHSGSIQLILKSLIMSLFGYKTCKFAEYVEEQKGQKSRLLHMHVQIFWQGQYFRCVTRIGVIRRSANPLWLNIVVYSDSPHARPQIQISLWLQEGVNKL